MQRIFPAIFLPLFLTPYVDARVPDTVLRQQNTAVAVHVTDRDGKPIASGTGFIVDRDGIIATNCRIIAKWFEKIENGLVVETEGGVQFPMGDLISSRCENNLALFKIAAKELPAVKLVKDYKQVRGERIAVAGGPSGSVKEGVIRTIRKKTGSFDLSVPITAEQSGSPVFNMKGEAIGAAISLPAKGKNISFAVSLRGIAKQLERYGKPKLPKKINYLPLREERKEEKKPADSNDYFSRGCVYDRLSMYKEAVKEYQQSLTINPDSVEAYVNLGTDYYKLGQYDNAVGAYKEAIRRRPDSSSVYNKLGATYIINCKYSMAVDSFKKALDIDPNDAVSHFNLGIAYFLNGDPDSAFDEYEILKGIDKERANTLINIIY